MIDSKNHAHSVLHVFNGDCAADAWKRSSRSSDPYVVWREIYLDGPLPPAGLSERKLLSLIEGGIHEFHRLFRVFNETEDRPFLGDSMCERLLNALVDRGFLECETDEQNVVRYYNSHPDPAMR